MASSQTKLAEDGACMGRDPNCPGVLEKEQILLWDDLWDAQEHVCRMVLESKSRPSTDVCEQCKAHPNAPTVLWGKDACPNSVSSLAENSTAKLCAPASASP